MGQVEYAEVAISDQSIAEDIFVQVVDVVSRQVQVGQGVQLIRQRFQQGDDSLAAEMIARQSQVCQLIFRLACVWDHQRKDYSSVSLMYCNSGSSPTVGSLGMVFFPH